MYKILRIANRFNLGGPTFNVAYLTKYIGEEFETVLIGGEKDQSEDSSTFILDDLDLKPLIVSEMKREINLKEDYKAYKKIKAIIKSYKPDIVHTHASKSGALGRLAAANCGVPIILHTFHGHVFHSYFGKIKTNFYKALECYLAKKSSKIIAISQKQKEELGTTHKIAPLNKIEVVRLGFNLDRFQVNQEQKRTEFRNKYNLKEEEIAIGIIGRLVPIKNHKLFLEGIKHLTETSNKKIKAFIIGDGEEKENLFNICNELKLDYSTPDVKKDTPVIFTSWIRTVEDAYAGLDLVALTSLNEGTPVSLIEAQAAGKPIISSKVGGIEDVVKDKETGLLFDLKNKKLFFDLLVKLVEDDNYRKKLSKNGVNWVNKNYHYSVLTENMRTLYLKELSQIRNT